jgi:hypothetical protein
MSTYVLMTRATTNVFLNPQLILKKFDNII